MAQQHTLPQPVSKTVQRLLAQVQAEAQAATLEALSAKDGIVALQSCDRATASLYHYSDGDFDLRDASGYRLELRRDRFEPKSWRGVPCMQGRWRPGQWDVRERRLDGHGNEWVRDMGAHITDDFGTLVSVEKGSA